MPRQILTAVMLGIACLANAPASAESQSSNSSSNCSNGRCTRSDSLVIQDDRGRQRGWHHVEHWREDRRDRARQHHQRPRDAWRPAPPRRDRDDDED